MTARTTFRLALCCVAAAVALSFVPTAVPTAEATAVGSARPGLSSVSATAISAVAKFRSAAAQDAALRAYTSPKSYTPVATTAPAPSVTTTTRRATAAPAARKASSPTKAKAPASELSQARSILAGLVSKYPILKGSTVEFGNAKGYQAITYYGSGRIVLSKTHTASLSRIVTHEAWHIIDWRDNGRIDWGESVPR